MSNIITTSLTTSPSDKLAVADVYKQNSTSTINNAPKTPPKSDSVSSRYVNIPTEVDASKERIERSRVEDALTVQEKIARISELERGLSGPLNRLPSNQIEEILSLMGSDRSKELTSVVVEGQRYNSKSYRDIDGLTKLVSAVTGNAGLMQMLDLESEGALIGGLIQEAIRLKIPQLVDTLLKEVSDEKLKKKLLIGSLESAARMGDIITVNRVIDEIGVNSALARVPNLIELILTGYRLPIAKDRKPLPQVAAELNATLIRIKTQWWLTSRDGETVNDLSAIAYASVDSRNLLILIDNLRHLFMIGRNFASANLMVLLRRAYPKAGFFNG